MKYAALIFFALFLLPRFVYAEIHITEIAWMGTVESQYSEWLELHNDGSEAVDLTGWKLYGGDSLIFTFTKTIEAGAYLLLERTTASAPDAVPGINDESGSFGGGGLANTGEDLLLKDANGASVESLPFSAGWPAGDATKKDTMQWDGAKWITAAPTPKKAASSPAVGTATASTKKKRSSSEEIDPYPIPPVSPNQPHIEFVIPTNVYAGVPYQYKAHPIFEYNYAIDHGAYRWNMGDGTILSQDSFVPLSYAYRYPGTYTISFLYVDPVNKNNTLSGTKKITVVSPALSLSIVDHKALEIRNTSPTATDLSGWTLVVPGQKILIPDMTIVAENANITIPFSTFSIEHASAISLADPSGTVVAATDPVPSTAAYVPADAPGIVSNDLPVVSDALASATPLDNSDQQKSPIRNRTKIFGAVALFVIVLSILLERFMARQEYS